jgi:hypothetical protein
MDHEEEHEPKLFSLSEAERARRVVEPLLIEAMEGRRQMADFEESLSAISNRIQIMGGLTVDYEGAARLRADLNRVVAKVKEAIDQIQATGCIVKDLDTGLVRPLRHIVRRAAGGGLVPANAAPRNAEQAGQQFEPEHATQPTPFELRHRRFRERHIEPLESPLEPRPQCQPGPGRQDDRGPGAELDPDELRPVETHVQGDQAPNVEEPALTLD